MVVNKMNRKVNLKSKTNRSVLKSNKTKKVSKTMNGGSKCGSNIMKGGSKCGSNIMKGGSKSVKRKVSRKKIESSRFRTLKKGKKELKRVRQNRTQKKGLKNKKYRTLKKKVTGGGESIGKKIGKRFFFKTKKITTKKNKSESVPKQVQFNENKHKYMILKKPEDTKEDEIKLQDIEAQKVNNLLKILVIFY